MARKLRPILEGSWWLIGASPNLDGKLEGDAEHRLAFEKGQKGEHNAPVDHHIVRDIDGIFHLWGCVRATSVGRVLYHWSTDSVNKSPWQDTGEFIRIDRGAGESIDDWLEQEWIQSPYFVISDGTYYMFYGGHRAGIDEQGNPQLPHLSGGTADPSLHQICLMTSPDGKRWTRYRNSEGKSRLVLGPGETRDPCVLKIDDLWYMYYAGYYDYDKPEEGAGFTVRTSKDLINWSDWRLVHRDPQYGARRGHTECPFVIEKEGYFYLFRTVDYYACYTLVFRSDDPYDFGVGDASDKLVARLPCAAPELYTIEGQEYVSSSHTPLSGEQMCKLRWIED